MPENIKEARELSSYVDKESDEVVAEFLAAYRTKGYKGIEKNWDARVICPELRAKMKTAPETWR